MFADGKEKKRRQELMSRDELLERVEQLGFIVGHRSLLFFLIGRALREAEARQAVEYLEEEYGREPEPEDDPKQEKMF